MKSGRNWGRLGMKFELKDICKTNQSNYSKSDKWTFINYLDTGNITKNKIDEIQYINLENEKLPSRAKRKVEIDDIIYSTVRPNQLHYGIIKQMPNNFLVSTGFTTIKINRKIAEPKFIFYYITQDEITEHLSAIAEQSTSAYPSIKPSDIENLEIDLPSLKTQKQIASILSALDDKIELNNKINENLESQAQAIFKSWFVDFEPFGGVMPEDWRTGSLSEICGYSKDKVNIEDLTLDTYYSTENMQPNRQGAVQATTLPTIKQTTACKKGNVLISNIRPYFKKIIYCFADCGCSTDVLCFVPNKSEYSAFLYCALYSDKFFDYMVAGSKGTKMPRGDKQQIMMYPLCIPSTEYVEQFSKIVAPMLETVYTNRLEANDLAILRDTLLPKLMKGEIDVSEVKI